MTTKTSTNSSRLVWVNIILFSLTAATSLLIVPWYGLTHGFSLSAWTLMFVVLAANEFAITAGYHRLWAHRTYKAHWALRALFLIFGTMALQNSVLVWCSGHRRHHIHVDDVELDPYAAKRGFWFSHIGWMLRHYPSGQQDFKNIPDLLKDPMLRFQHKHYALLTLILNIGLPLLLGTFFGHFLGIFLLVGVLRLTLSHHLTFFINSLAHMWGTRPYTEVNTARDNPVLAVLTFGEGYHNFHHLFAHDYRNGVMWWQWDPTKWLIKTLSIFGLTYELRQTGVFQIQKAALLVQFFQTQRFLEKASKYFATDHIKELKERLSLEYERFTTTVNEWFKIKESWLSNKKHTALTQWDKLDFQTQLERLERALEEQRSRLKFLQFRLVLKKVWLLSTLPV